MSRFRVVLGVVVLLVIAGGWSVGQEKKTADDKKEPPTKVRGQLPANWKKLGLTDEQVQKVYRIKNDYDSKIDALKLKIDALKKEEQVEMEKVLTDAQKARLKEIKSGEK